MVYPVLVALRITLNYGEIRHFCILHRTSNNNSILSAQNCRTGHSDQNDVLHDIKHVTYSTSIIVARNLYY